MPLRYNGELVTLAEGAPVQAVSDASWEIEGSATASFPMTETDQASPAGRWRWRLSGDTVALQRATGTDPDDPFSSFDTIWTGTTLGALAALTAGITAGTTQTQAGGTALPTEICVVATVANDDDVVTLPAAVAGRRRTIINNGANRLGIFPAVGDDVGAGANTVYAGGLISGGNITFLAIDATTWEQVVLTFDATVPVTQAFSDSAAAGSAVAAARRDHVHGMPAGGVTREGGNTSETTTTSTSLTSLLTTSSLTIAVGEQILGRVAFRKTAGAASCGRWLLRLNSTDVTADTTWNTSADALNEALMQFQFVYGVASYLKAGFWFTRASDQGNFRHDDFTTDMPTVELTDIVARCRVESTAVLHGADEMHIWQLPNA